MRRCWDAWKDPNAKVLSCQARASKLIKFQEFKLPGCHQRHLIDSAEALDQPHRCDVWTAPVFRDKWHENANCGPVIQLEEHIKHPL
jgi:hypothetical protein